MTITRPKVQHASATRPERHVVRIDERAVGFVERFRATSSTLTPWIAYAGIGMDATYIDAVYGPIASAVDLVVAHATAVPR